MQRAPRAQGRRPSAVAACCKECPAVGARHKSGSQEAAREATGAQEEEEAEGKPPAACFFPGCAIDRSLRPNDWLACVRPRGAAPEEVQHDDEGAVRAAGALQPGPSGQGAGALPDLAPGGAVQGGPARAAAAAGRPGQLGRAGGAGPGYEPGGQHGHLHSAQRHPRPGQGAARLLHPERALHAQRLGGASLWPPRGPLLPPPATGNVFLASGEGPASSRVAKAVHLAAIA
eukprot:scaffold1094_cov322-Prasinococcus_capsulatus_cf.AAC.3